MNQCQIFSACFPCIHFPLTFIYCAITNVRLTNDSFFLILFLRSFTIFMKLGIFTHFSII